MTIAGLKTHFVRAGKGEPVILLHGLASSSYTWRFAVPELAKRYEVFAPDLPGFGRTDKPWDFDYSIEGQHLWVLAFMDALGLPKARFVGNSMGGVITLWTAMETPERVESMALLGTPGYPENRPKLLWPLSWPVFGPLYERLLGERVLRWIAQRTFVDKTVITEELISEYAAPLRSPEGRRAVAQFIRKALPSDWKERVASYASLRQPALVLVGSSDTLIDRAGGERLARDLGNARFHYLDACGHSPQDDAPDRVLPLLTEFFA